MEIKHLFTRSLALCGVAVALTACNLEDQLVPERVTSDPGYLDLRCAVDPSVNEQITRADETPAGMTKLPDEVMNLVYKEGDQSKGLDYSKLALRIWGTYDNPTTKDGAAADNLYEVTFNPYDWETLSGFQSSHEEFQRGFYYARIESIPEMAGDKIKEGVNNPYFVYETPNDPKALTDPNSTVNEPIRVKALETTKVEAELKLANSCLKLQTTQALMDYYTEIELTIHSADGKITFKPGTVASDAATASGTTGSSGEGTTGSSGTGTTGSGTTTDNTNEVVAWDSYTDGGESLYFFNVSEPVKINTTTTTLQTAFTTALKLSGYAKKQNGVKVYFTSNGKADGDPVEIKPKDANGKDISLAAGTLYSIKVGHSTAGTTNKLEIIYNDYGEADITVIELRPDEEDNTTSGDDTTSGGSTTGGDTTSGDDTTTGDDTTSGGSTTGGGTTSGDDTTSGGTTTGGDTTQPAA